MCMICKGIKKGKFTIEAAKDKLEELVDLDLIDEDHQEELETLIAETEEELYHWSSAKKDFYDAKYKEDYDEEFVEEEDYEEDISEDEDED